jgi:pre-mRNA-splicing factor ISY1
VDASYYGYNLDEEDGTLLAYEAGREAEAREALLKEARGIRKGHGGGDGGGGGQKRAEGGHEDEDDEISKLGVPEGWEPLPGDAGDGVPWRLPTLEEVSEELVERRRRRLLDTLG